MIREVAAWAFDRRESEAGVDRQVTSAVVPDPASAGVLAVAAAGRLGRRRQN